MTLAYPLLFSSFLTVFFSASTFAGEADSSMAPIKLPRPLTDGKVSVEKALQERRSIRQYRNLPITLSDLSQLLWAAQGISGSGGRRTAPSAGALYPLALSVIAGNVTGLPPGVYSYDPQRHELNRTVEGDMREDLGRAALGQSSIKQAAAVLVISAVYERVTIKYGERGVRYVHMEAGHAAQNVFLQTVPLDLGTVVIGAFRDDAVRAVLRRPVREQPLYIMPLGRR